MTIPGVNGSWVQPELPFESDETGPDPSEARMEKDLEAHASDVIDLVLERHRKYGPYNIAHSPGGPLNGIAVRLYDKVSRLANTAENFDDESVEDTIRDIVGYGLIALLVQNGQWPA